MKTLIQKLNSVCSNDNEIYIKRDDLLPFSMGGNKVRIAEAFFADMKEQGCDCMVIYGSRHSNLCRVLSALCRSRKTPCYMICSSEEGEDTAATNNTKLVEWAGTHIVHCGKTNIAETVEKLMNDLSETGYQPYYIYGTKFGTGNEGTAAAAYANAYQEILDFEQESGFRFDYIFSPSGTGATQSGLICGHLMAGDETKIMGVLISSRETGRARNVIDEGVRDYFAKHPEAGPLPEGYQSEIILLDQYRKGGYGLYDDEIRDCIREVYCQEGIPMDPIYVAKAFCGMNSYLKQQGISAKKILFLHTGGTPLFYDYLEQQEL